MKARLPRTRSCAAAILGGLLAIAGLALSTPARADVPGPRKVCDTEGLACETCWEHYGASPEDKAAFDKCKEPLVAKGYTEACRNNQGAGDNVVFCAPNTDVPKVTKGGGCGGCSTASGAATDALVGLCVGLTLLAARRRRPR